VMDSLGMALTLAASHFLRTHGDFFRRLQSEGGDVGLIVELPAAPLSASRSRLRSRRCLPIWASPSTSNSPRT